MLASEPVGTDVMMILRAVFWIGLVALLMPHEPELGRAGPGASLPATPITLSSAADALAQAGMPCDLACVGAGFVRQLGLAPDGTLTQGLARVKAQIDADIAAREQRGHFSL